MATVNNTVIISYNINGRISQSVQIRYDITYRLSQSVNIRYDIIETSHLQNSVKILYTIIHSRSVFRRNTEKEYDEIGPIATVSSKFGKVKTESITIESAEGSYCLSCEIIVATEQSWRECVIGESLNITIYQYLNGIVYSTLYGFLIDSPSRSRVFGRTIYTVRARSNTSKLDFPTADAISFINGGEKTAFELCEGICSDCEIALEWNIIDWELPKGILVVEGESPLNVVRKIAAAAGGILQSHLSESKLIVQYKYSTDGPEESISDALDILKWSETQYRGRGFNVVRVSDRTIINEDDSTYIYIELDEDRNGGKSSFAPTDTIFLRVYSSAPYSIQVTSGSITKIAEDEVSEVEGDIMLFDGETYPSVSKPINEVGTNIWYGNDLGAITKIGSSEVIAAGAGPDTLGISKAAYDVKYDVWRLVPPVDISGEYHIYVKSLQTGEEEE